MNMKKSIISIVITGILFLFLSNSFLLAYRGSDADRCGRKIWDDILSKSGKHDNDEKHVKSIIETVNKDSRCQYEYTTHDGKLVVFCKTTHGSGSNRSMLNTMSVDSYYRDRFNHAGEYSFLLLGGLGLCISIFRSLKKKNK